MDWYNTILDKDFKTNLISEWENLLDKNLTEKYYHKFLADNAGLFLGNDDCHLAISKLKLGSELETDFVTVTDGFSNGNLYELIEIKQPSAKLFTEKGMISSDLNRATQQIRDWKRWLIDNRTWFKNHLPTISTRVVNKSHLKFKIIIGRRLSNTKDIDKRNQIGEEIGAEIRSFDYLTDRLRKRVFYPTAWLSDKNYMYEQSIANPFYKAISDSDWKKFCKSEDLANFHFYSAHCKKILEMRKYNDRIKTYR